MKFDFIHTSLDNFGEVGSEELTAYDTLILMEQLLKDVKAETGKDVAQLEMGDECLPTAMLRILRSILAIYNAKKDVLTRNRDRLDEKVAECRQAEVELHNLETVGAELSAKASKLSELTAKLKEAREAKQDCEHIDAEIQKAEQELASLQCFDCTKAHETLTTLRAKCAAIAAETETLKKELQEDTERHRVLESQRDCLTVKLSQMRLEIQAADASCSDLSKQEQQLSDAQAKKNAAETALKLKIEGLKQELEIFLAEHIQPLQREFERLEEERLRKTAQEEELKKRNADVSSAISRINATNDEIDRVESELQQKQRELQQKQQELSQAQKRRGELCKKVQALEAEIYETDSRNREQKAAKEAAEGRLLKKREEKAHLEEDLTKLQAALDALTEEAAPLEKKAEELRAEHTALATSTGLLHDEIEALEAKIKELRDAGVESRARTYKKQLEEEQQQLETAKEECGTMEEEIKHLSEQLAEISAKRAELSRIVEENKKNVDAIDRKREELSRSVTAEYQEKTRALACRLNTLNRAYENLNRAVVSMTAYLGVEPMEMEYSIKQGLSLMTQKISQLSEALVRCADSLKLEET